MINAKTYKPKSPEWVMAKFFDCWRRRAWIQMLTHVQNSWVALYGEEASKQIKATLNRKLVNTRFVQRNNTTPAMAEYLIEVKYSAWQHCEIVTKMLKVRLIRERKGWGIVPKSVAVK